MRSVNANLLDTVPAASCGMSSAICGSGKMVFSSIWRSPGPLENTARGRRWRSRSCFRRWRRSCCGNNFRELNIKTKRFSAAGFTVFPFSNHFHSIKNSRPAIHFILREAAVLLTIFTQSKPALPLQSEEWSGRISSVRGLRTQRPSHLPFRSRNASQAAADRYRRHGR